MKGFSAFTKPTDPLSTHPSGGKHNPVSNGKKAQTNVATDGIDSKYPKFASVIHDEKMKEAPPKVEKLEEAKLDEAGTKDKPMDNRLKKVKYDKKGNIRKIKYKK